MPTHYRLLCGCTWRKTSYGRKWNYCHSHGGQTRTLDTDHDAYVTAEDAYRDYMGIPRAWHVRRKGFH